MSVQEFRNNPIDKRRLSEPSRSQYSSANTQEAMSRVKSYRRFNNYEANRPRNTSGQKPGTGGFSLGRFAQGERQRMETAVQKRQDYVFKPEGYEYNNIQEGQMTKEESDRALVGGLTQRSDGEYFKVGNNISSQGNEFFKEVASLSGSKIDSRSGNYDPKTMFNSEYEGGQSPDAYPNSYNDGSSSLDFKEEEKYKQYYAPQNIAANLAKTASTRYF